MSLELDEHAAQRAELLAPVRELCGRAGVQTEAGPMPPERYGRQPAVMGLRHVAADGSWDAFVTVVRGHPQKPQAQQASGRYARASYSLSSPGELVYEVQVHEEDDHGSGHGPRPLVVFEVVGTPQAAADVVTLWASRASLFRYSPPDAKPERTARQEKRRFDHRRAAALSPKVDATAVPPEGGPDVAAVDQSLLCWNFPRERYGRYSRSAVVALAPCGDGRAGRPHLAGTWLTARADGDALALEVRGLVPADQAHRWDVTPWLWNRHHRDAPAMLRWQLPEADDARTAFTALREGKIRAALEEHGVLVDASISRLLDGEPTRLFRADLTEKWVRNLYAGLADAAPWRLAAAYTTWREGRDALGLRTTDPVTLFGLGGMSQTRKPKVALDMTPAGPVLRFRYTGGTAVLSRSLWTIPPDLEASLRGWAPPAFGTAIAGQ